MGTSREGCPGWGAVELSFLGATLHVSTHAPSTCMDISPPRAGSGPEVPAAGRGRGPPPRNRRTATAHPGADSRAAPRGASAGAAGGAAVVLERLADRGAGVLRAASRPASRLVHRPESTDATSPMRPLVVDHAVRPSRLRSSTAWRTARRARRAFPCSRCRCRSRPAIGVRFTGARASRCRADAKTGSQPTAFRPRGRVRPFPCSASDDASTAGGRYRATSSPSAGARHGQQGKHDRAGQGQSRHRRQVRGDGELVGCGARVPGAVLGRAGRDVHRHGAGGPARDHRGVGRVVPLQL